MLKERQGGNHSRNDMQRDLIFRKRRFPVVEILIYINLLEALQIVLKTKSIQMLNT